MNTKQFKYLGLATVVLILFAGILIVLNNVNDQVSEVNAELTQISKDEITKIEIIKKDQTTTLEKQEEVWKIGEDEADVDQINKFLEDLTATKLNEKVSTNKENHSKFRVSEDEKRILKIYKGDEVSLEIFLGKTNSLSYTYIRYPNQDSVYTIDKDLTSFFDMNEESLRKVEEEELE